MKHLLPYSYAITTLLLLGACSSDEFTDEQVVGASQEIQKITVTLPELSLVDETNTRAEYVYNASKDAFSFIWSDGDVLGVYPDAGSQIDFPISTEDVGKSSAHFDGGGWALKAGSRYSLYYPYNYEYTEKSAIPLDYRGQEQVAKNDFSHLFNYNYFASKEAVWGDESGALDFKVGYLGTIYWLPFTMPEAATLTKLRLISSDVPFMQTAYLNISNEVPDVYPGTESNTVTLKLNNLEVSAGELVNFYMWVLPRDFTSGTITAEIVTSDRVVYTADVTPSVALEAGSFRRFKRGASGQKTITKKAELDPETINFADETVKAICVENWDTNGDGELDMDEAAAVTDLGDFFSWNQEINNFNELRYFTGLTSIADYAFEGCLRLWEIELPESVKTIGNSAFSECGNLYHITMPGVTSIGESAFYRCRILGEIDLPESVKIIGNFAFSECENLFHVTMPGVTTIGENAFFKAALWDITLSPVLEEIGDFAFESVTGLNGITLPATLTSMGIGAFYNSPLRYVNLDYDEDWNVKEYHLTSIPESAFGGCTGLQYVPIPSSVTTIGNWAFSDCSSLRNVYLPENLTAIGTRAFSATALTEIDIPASVTEMGECALNASYLQKIIWNAPLKGITEPFYLYNYESVIYVPNEMVETTKEWYPEYADRIKSIESMSGGETGGSTTATMPDLNFGW